MYVLQEGETLLAARCGEAVEELIGKWKEAKRRFEASVGAIADEFGNAETAQRALEDVLKRVGDDPAEQIAEAKINPLIRRAYEASRLRDLYCAYREAAFALAALEHLEVCMTFEARGVRHNGEGKGWALVGLDKGRRVK